jgi:hypothetical protein
MNRFKLFAFSALVLVCQSEAFALPSSQSTPAPEATPAPYGSPAPEDSPTCVSKGDPVALELLTDLLEPTTNEVECFAYAEGDQLCQVCSKPQNGVGCCKYWQKGLVGVGARFAFKWETDAACNARRTQVDSYGNTVRPKIVGRDQAKCAYSERNAMKAEFKENVDRGRDAVGGYNRIKNGIEAIGRGEGLGQILR